MSQPALKDPVVSAERVSKKFCRGLKRSLWYGVRDIAGELALWRDAAAPVLRPGEFWALDDVSFAVRPGEALGVLGLNGSGKSTLLRLLGGLMKPDAGRIAIRGRVGALIELGAGFSPLLSGRENVYVNAAILGLTRRQTDEFMDAIIDFAEATEFIDAPVQGYSSGMWVRLAYAIAAHLRPDVLLVDEVLAVGDFTFRRKCLQHMHRFVQNGGALVLVSHDVHVLQSVCARTLLLERGRVSLAGTTVDAVSRYLEDRSGAPLRGPGGPPLGADQPVFIEHVDLVPVRGDALRTAEPARVVLRYRSRIDLAPVHWGISLWTPDLGVCVAYIDDDQPRGALRMGTGTLSCLIPSLSLNSGRFVVRAAIADASLVPLTNSGWHTFWSISITSAASRPGNTGATLGALVRLEAEWE